MAGMEERLRSPIKYFGGKGNRVSRLLSLVPAGGRPYCEPFAGGASLFFAREPAPIEVLNDVDGDVVNLFRVLQNRQTFEELRHRLMYTPYARAEFLRAVEILKNGGGSPVERAWAYFVFANQSFSCGGRTSDGFICGNWGMTFTPARGTAGVINSWLMRLSMLDAFCHRLRLAYIENRDALDVIRYWDNDEAVFYVDPPYPQEARGEKRYQCEFSPAQWQQLIDVLLACRGTVVLTTYDNEATDRLREAGWRRIAWETSCHSAIRRRDSGLRGEGAATRKVPRTEVVYLNQKA